MRREAIKSVNRFQQDFSAIVAFLSASTELLNETVC